MACDTARVVVAPDSFGGSLTAVQAATAIAAGWTARRPADRLTLTPVSDGGPGFVDTLATRGGETAMQTVAGPLGAPVSARWLRRDSVAFIECAQACGLTSVPEPNPQTAWAATTRGVGELIAAAVDAGARRIIVGLGGSATTDGGRGLVEALGGPAHARRRLEGVDVVAATDVTNPLLGASGAAAVFGPQKGADAATVGKLATRLEEWAPTLDALAGRCVTDQPGAGAAGGLGAALLALGARRVSGARLVADELGIGAALDAADLLITGEGSLDRQTLGGKAAGLLASMARERGVAAMALCGQVRLAPAQLHSAGIDVAHAMVASQFRGRPVDSATSIREAATVLEAVADHAAARWSAEV